MAVMMRVLVGVSSKTAELHFSQLIIRGVPEYISLIALMIACFPGNENEL